MMFLQQNWRVKQKTVLRDQQKNNLLLMQIVQDKSDPQIQAHWTYRPEIILNKLCCVVQLQVGEIQFTCYKWHMKAGRKKAAG